MFYTEHLSGKKICAERLDVFYTEHLSGKICAEVRCVLHGAFIRKNMCRGCRG